MSPTELDIFDSHINFLISSKKRRYGILLIHFFAICATAHLIWVSFFIKTDLNPVPEEFLLSTLLFALVYLTILVLWCITIPFTKKIPKGVNLNTFINKILFDSIGYISPFKSAEKPFESILRANMPVYMLFLRKYYDISIFGFLILFAFGFYQMTTNPNEAMVTMKILNSGIGFFCTTLIIFYGFWSALSVISLKILCFLFHIHHSFSARQM